ncbi:MAG: glycoside hydrolase family 99-like domain-containing protein [Candidatus Accumulibacter sp. UW26]|jgi:hypothetical protein
MEKYAIFFPQYHQVDVNDAAWGRGFTDWALVAAANAFDLWQRRAPACGFYDLSDKVIVSRLFQEAADSGLDGFGIYHYRFEDGPELTAVEVFLEECSLPADFGYFFIWANENWSRRWAGKDTELLKTVPTQPSRDQIRSHVNYLKPFMQAEGYKRIDGRPLFVVYRPEFFVDPLQAARLYREEFNSAGIDIALAYFLNSPADGEYSRAYDFGYLFEPRLFFRMTGIGRSRMVTTIFRWLTHALPYSYLEALSELVRTLSGRKSARHEFSTFLKYFGSTERQAIVQAMACPVQNVLTCGWNNAPRYRDRYTALAVPSARQFQEMLELACSDAGMCEKLPLLCNAWNEWSEGAALEACAYLGTTLQESYLPAQNSSILTEG